MAKNKPNAGIATKSAGQLVVLARLQGRGGKLLPILHKEAIRRNWRLVCRSGEALDFKPGFRIDGALVQDLPGSPQVLALQKRGCAVVRAGRFPHPDDRELPAVLPDIKAWGRMAADFFHERGFLHVSYLQQAKPIIHAQPFFDEFRLRSEVLGMVCHPLRLALPPADSKISEEDLVSYQMDRFIRSVIKLPKPCGMLFLGAGAMAHYVSWLLEHGVRVPEEIAALGCGGPALAFEHHNPSLSSVDDDLVKYVEAACDLLAGLMEGGEATAGPVFIPPRGITERESTASVGVQDSVVAAAVRYIRQNFNRNISVDDVADEVGVGRRSLERRFREHLGRGVNAELMRRRLQVFRERLCTTNLSIVVLARQSGFRTLSHLRSSFRTAYGESPIQCRQRHCSKTA